MKKRLRIISFILGVLILIPLTVLFILSRVHHHSAHEEFVNFLNHEFDGKVSFNNFSFSYIQHFPKAHIKLEGVSVKGDTTEVVSIGQLDIIVNTFGLWRKQIELKELIISDAEFMSVVDSLGNKVKILAGKDKNSDSIHKAMLIDAKNIEIRDSKVYFENKVKGNRTGIHIHHAWLDAQSKDSLLIIKGKFDGYLDSLVSNNTVLFANQPVKAFNVELEVNRFNGFKELKDGYILAHTLKLMPRFKMKPHEDGQLIELHISGEDNFDTFLDLFEFHTGFDLEQVKPEATLKLSYNQEGFVNPFQRPYSELDFEISYAEFTGETLPFPIEVKKIAGNYNNGLGHSPQTVELVIDTIYAYVSESFIRGRFELNNLHDPFVDAHIVADLDLSHLIKDTKNIRLAGAIDFDLSLSGKINELKKLHLEGKQTARGVINVDHLELILNEQGYSIELLNGASLLDNHILEITTLIGTFNESAFHFQGHLENLGQYIINDDENLLGKFALNIDEIDLTQINFGLPPNENKKESTFSPFSYMALEFIVNAKKIITPQGDVNNLEFDCRLSNNIINIRSMDFDFQEGHINGVGEATFDKNGLAGLNAEINGKFNDFNLTLPKTNQNKSKTKVKSFHLPEELNVKLELAINQGALEEIPLKNLHLSSHVYNNEILIKKFNVDVFGGHSDLNGRVLFDSTGLKDIQINANLNAYHLVVDELLNKFGKKPTTKPGTRKLALPEELDITINLNAADVFYKDAEIKSLRTKIRADNNRLLLKDFNAVLPFGLLAMDISAADYRSNQIQYSGWIDLSIDTLSVDKLLDMKALGLSSPNGKNNNKSISKNKSPLKDLPENINLQVSANADQLSYKNTEVKNMSLMIEYLDDKINLSKLDFKFAGGSANLKGNVIKDKSIGFPGYIYSKADTLKMEKFLNAFDNFNQQVFTVENTSGNISWATHCYFNLGNDLIPRMDENFWILNFIIHEARLMQVKPIEDALFFVGHKAKDTMFIQRLNLSAVIDADRLLFRDLMMNNNIANLEALGIIDLDEKSMEVDLEISLSDLFFRTRKNRMEQTQEGNIDLEKDSKLFLKMEGQLNNHKLSKSNKKKFNKFRKGLFNEIKQAEQEFIYKRDKQ